MKKEKMTNEEAAKQALQSLCDTCYIHMNENTECAYKDGYQDGAYWGYNRALEQVKEWLLQTTLSIAVDKEEGLYIVEKFVKDLT